MREVLVGAAIAVLAACGDSDGLVVSGGDGAIDGSPTADARSEDAELPGLDAGDVDGGGGAIDAGHDAGDAVDAGGALDAGPLPPMCTTVSPPGECDVFARDCPAGERCTAVRRMDGTVTTSCYPTGDRADGVSCTSPSDCAPDLTCFGGRCRPTCCVSARDCADADRWCVPWSDFGIGVCVNDGCSLLLGAEDCPRFRHCRIMDDVTFCADVPSGGTIPQEGQACDHWNACGAFTQCLVADDLPVPVCTRFCRFAESEADCATSLTGYTCVGGMVRTPNEPEGAGGLVTLPAGIGVCR